MDAVEECLCPVCVSDARRERKADYQHQTIHLTSLGARIKRTRRQCASWARHHVRRKDAGYDRPTPITCGIFHQLSADGAAKLKKAHLDGLQPSPSTSAERFTGASKGKQLAASPNGPKTIFLVMRLLRAPRIGPEGILGNASLACGRVNPVKAQMVGPVVLAWVSKPRRNTVAYKWFTELPSDRADVVA